MLAGFFVMGFGDIIGTVMNQVKAECAAHAPEDAYFTENQHQVELAVKIIHAGRKLPAEICQKRINLFQGSGQSLCFRVHRADTAKHSAGSS